MAKNIFLHKKYTYNGQEDICGFCDVSWLKEIKAKNLWCDPNYHWDTIENDSPNSPAPVIRKTTVNGKLLTQEYLDDLIASEADVKILSDTDWIVAKIQEASILGEDTAPLLEKYSGELQARRTARANLDALPSYDAADEVTYNIDYIARSDRFSD